MIGTTKEEEGREEGEEAVAATLQMDCRQEMVAQNLRIMKKYNISVTIDTDHYYKDNHDNELLRFNKTRDYNF